MKSIQRLFSASRRTRTAQTAALVLFISILSSGCIGTPAMLQPASDNATQISNLTQSILVIAAAVFIIVEGLLIFTSFRYRKRPNAPLPRQVSGNTALEIGWTAFPAIVLAIVFALTLGTLIAIDTPPAQAGAPASNASSSVNVLIIGHQWWWEIQYPDLGIITANEMHVPANANIIMKLQSNDVIHSFWVPQIGRKLDAIPGRINTNWFRSGNPGRYDGQCAEFCGAEHALMHVQIVVDTPDQFQAWVNDQKAPIPTNLTGQAAVGEQMFLAASCTACHTIKGTKAQGQIGPDLTHFASRAKFAGGSFDNIPANVSDWIQHPRELKPGTVMPDLGIMPNMGDTITSFLETLK